MTAYRNEPDPAPANVTPAPDVESAAAVETFDADGNVVKAVLPLPALRLRETPEQEAERLEGQRRLQAAREAAALPGFVPAQSEESKTADEEKVAAQRAQREAARQKQEEDAAKQRDAESAVRTVNADAAPFPPFVPPSPATVSVQDTETAFERLARERREAKAAAKE